MKLYDKRMVFFRTAKIIILGVEECREFLLFELEFYFRKFVSLQMQELCSPEVLIDKHKAKWRKVF